MEDIDTQDLKGIFGGFNPQPEPPPKEARVGWSWRGIIQRPGGQVDGLGRRGIGIGEMKPGAKAGGGQKGFSF